MNYNNDKLERKTFDRLISEAYLDYLFCEGFHAEYYAMGGEFSATDTPNRNMKQVPAGLWQRLLSRHINKNYYN